MSGCGCARAPAVVRMRLRESVTWWLREGVNFVWMWLRGGANCCSDSVARERQLVVARGRQLCLDVVARGHQLLFGCGCARVPTGGCSRASTLFGCGCARASTLDWMSSREGANCSSDVVARGRQLLLGSGGARESILVWMWLREGVNCCFREVWCAWRGRRCFARSGYGSRRLCACWSGLPPSECTRRGCRRYRSPRRRTQDLVRMWRERGERSRRRSCAITDWLSQRTRIVWRVAPMMKVEI